MRAVQAQSPWKMPYPCQSSYFGDATNLQGSKNDNNIVRIAPPQRLITPMVHISDIRRGFMLCGWRPSGQGPHPGDGSHCWQQRRRLRASWHSVPRTKSRRRFRGFRDLEVEENLARAGRARIVNSAGSKPSTGCPMHWRMAAQKALFAGIC